ncbi:MAG: polysulfide reductase NrfD [Proteobacteria bacterium]|nr:polysulfide reductase NrfD [Burkholderiales bacterium]
MPDTFFTASPHWGWLIVFYFFIGGIAGAAFFLSALLHLFGRAADRPVVRTGYLVALSGVIVSAILLVVDLSRPLRFWHMLIQSNTGWPMFKAWSPMSVGSWAFALFGVFTALAALGAWAEIRAPASPLRRLANGLPGKAIAVLGGSSGVFVAGYTGVMLSVTNRPLWGDSSVLGGLFLSSAASGAAAVLVLATTWRGRRDATSLEWLQRVDRGALMLKGVLLVAVVVSLGAAAQVLVGIWGVALAAVLIGGVLVPLLMRRGRWSIPERPMMVASALLVLAGGFLLRVVVIFSSESVYVMGAGVHGP